MAMKGGDNMIDLKAERTKMKLTQQELADKVDVVRQTISMIERGENKPSIELAKRIGEVLKFEWFLFFKD